MKRYLQFLFIIFPIFCFCDKTQFIFITGGSASGKTTFAKKLVKRLGEERASYISLDEYLDKRVQPETDFIDGIPNFDNPSMINWSLLKANIARMQSGQSIQTPIYDFSLWMPTDFREMSWKPFVIIEGIHSTQDSLDDIPGLRVFLELSEEKRYQRRVVRDVLERKYPLEMIEKTFFKMAVPYQKIFLDPTRNKANIYFENFEGEEYLEQAVGYVAALLFDHKSSKSHITFDQGHLLVQFEDL